MNTKLLAAARFAACAAMATLLAGCASFDGRGLAVGTATMADTEALMGPAAFRVSRPDGSTVLYFSRQPIGRKNYAATFAPEGRLRGIEQLLTLDNINKLKPGEMNQQQVREALGPPDPSLMTRFTRQQRDVWEYPWLQDDHDRRILAVQFSYDGILREVINLRDDYYESPGAMP